MEMRTHVYVQRPGSYEIVGCECGNTDPDWSEFRDHLWCQKCEKDFIPAHYGIFDGPVCVTLCALLGISFDRINLATQELEPDEFLKAE